MSIWLYINIFLLLTVLFMLNTPLLQAPIHIVFGLLGLFLFLINWTRHAIFSTIRKTPERKKKIRLANISKRIYPFHRWVGSLSLVVILLHAFFVIERFGFMWTNWKMFSGLSAALVLTFMVLTGWLRLYFPSGRKRKAHLYIGFILFYLVALHTILF